METRDSDINRFYPNPEYICTSQNHDRPDWAKKCADNNSLLCRQGASSKNDFSRGEAQAHQPPRHGPKHQSVADVVQRFFGDCNPSVVS